MCRGGQPCVCGGWGLLEQQGRHGRAGSIPADAVVFSSRALPALRSIRPVWRHGHGAPERLRDGQVRDRVRDAPSGSSRVDRVDPSRILRAMLRAPRWLEAAQAVSDEGASRGLPPPADLACDVR